MVRFYSRRGIAGIRLRALASIGIFASILVAPAMAQSAGDTNAEVTVAPTPAWATPSEPLLVPADVQGPAFVRKSDSIVRLTEDGARNYQGQMLRILQPQALQIGSVAITWNPASGAPQVHALRIHRGARVIDVLDTTSFEVLRREDQPETAMLDGLLTATLQVPDLRVGDDLELAFTVPAHDPTLGATSSGLLVLADAPPPGRFRLELGWEDGQKPLVQMTPEFAASVQRSDNAITLAYDDPAAIMPPRDAPPRFAWTRIVEYSDFEDWSAVSRRFEALFAAASTLDAGSSLREEAAIIATAHQGDLARAQAALELVQQQVRYVYVGLNGGNYTPASADLTWERRYGDCKGKTAMLLAVLGELGIEAHAVLVPNSLPSDGFDERLPNPGLFDHVLVRAVIDGEDYWMDGTLPPVIEARPQPFFAYRWVLPLVPEGADLARLPDTPPAMPQEMGLVEYDARAGFEAPARIVRTTVSRGPAALQEYLQFSSVSANQLQSAFAGQLSGSAEWDDVETVEYRFDRETQASILTISGTGPIDWDDDGDGAYSLALPGGGFSPPTRRQRGPDQDASAPYWQAPAYSCHVTTVRLPEGTDLANWGFNSTIDTMLFGRAYYRMMEERDDMTMRLVRGSRVEDREISHERAARDNERLEDFDNSKAILTYDPDRTMNSWGDLRSVAATYEFDWTAPDAPCLPPDMLEAE